MDDAAVRKAHELIELADRRLVALLEAGVLDAGILIKRLREAREEVEAGDVVAAMATCDEVLDRAHSLAERGPTPSSRAAERVRTDRQVRRQSDRIQIPEPLKPKSDRFRIEAAPTTMGTARVEALVSSAVERRTQEALAAVQEKLRHLPAAEARTTHLEERLEANAQMLAELGQGMATLRTAIPQLVAETVAQHVSKTLETLVPSAAPGDSAVSDRIDQLGAELQATISSVTAIGAGVAELRSAMPGLIAEAIGSEIRQAMGALPAKHDLDQVANAIRKDLDWQVEKIAAERGWVTINDVQAALTGQPKRDPGAPATAVFARLEAALTEFVKQNQVQQERFLGVMQKRFESGTRALAQDVMTAALSRMPGMATVARRPRDAGTRDTEALPTDEALAALMNEAGAAGGVSIDLDVLSGTSQVRMLAEGPVSVDTGDQGSEVFVDPKTKSLTLAHAQVAAAQTQEASTSGDDGQPSEIFADALGTDDEASTRRLPTSKPDRSAIDPVTAPHQMGTSGLHRGTVKEVASIQTSAMPTEPTADDIIAQIAAELSTGGTSKAVRSTVMPAPVEVDASPAAMSTLLPSEYAPLAERLAALEARLALSLSAPTAAVDLVAASSPMPIISDAAILRERILGLLPELLADPAIRQRILGMVAVEAVANPGALGEITGIRAFLRREVRQAGEECAAQLRREYSGDPAPV